MRRSLLLCMLLAAAPLATFAQATAPAPLSGKLLFSGSSTLAPVVEDLAKRFRIQHPGVAIIVEKGGSGRGVADAIAGKSDIGMASRELHADERALFAIPIGRDGVVFVVHKDNPVRGLTRAQALDLFTGKIINWKPLRGRDAPIEVVTRAPGRSSVEIITHYLGITPEAIKAAHVIGDNDDVVRLVAANRNAIAFLSVGAADRAEEHLSIKALALDGIAPGVGSVRDGTWPLSRPLHLLTRRVPAGVAKAFIEFAISPGAHPVLLEHDFVPYAN